MAESESTAVASSRYRFTVPPADTSVQQWIETQDNLSASLRTIIRESIERDGYVDATCKPVEQLPRRGRPVGQATAPAAAPADPVHDHERSRPAQRDGDFEVPLDERGDLDLESIETDDPHPDQVGLGYSLAAERAGNAAVKKSAEGPKKSAKESAATPPTEEAEPSSSTTDDENEDDDMGSLFSSMRD